MCLWATFLVPILSLISANVKHIFLEPWKKLVSFSSWLLFPFHTRGYFSRNSFPFSFTLTHPQPFIPQARGWPECSGLIPR